MNLDDVTKSFGLDRMWTLLSEKLENWFELGVKTFPNLIVAILVFILFVFAGRILQNIVARIMSRLTQSESVRNLAVSTSKIIAIACGIFTALGILQLDKAVTSLLAGAGVIGLALGFAFQDIASNFISGICIAIGRPFKVGDIVESGDYLGTITDISLRTTTITTFQGLEVFMPNRILFTDPMTNYTKKPKRRVDLSVGVSYGDDLSKVERLLKEKLDTLPNRIKSEKISVFFTEFGASSINLVCCVWVEYPSHSTYLETQSEAIKLIKSVFDENDITIPFPIRTLDFGIKGGEKLSAVLPQS